MKSIRLTLLLATGLLPSFLAAYDPTVSWNVDGSPLNPVNTGDGWSVATQNELGKPRIQNYFKRPTDSNLSWLASGVIANHPVLPGAGGKRRSRVELDGVYSYSDVISVTGSYGPAAQLVFATQDDGTGFYHYGPDNAQERIPDLRFTPQDIFFQSYTEPSAMAYGVAEVEFWGDLNINSRLALNGTNVISETYSETYSKFLAADGTHAPTDEEFASWNFSSTYIHNVDLSAGLTITLDRVVEFDAMHTADWDGHHEHVLLDSGISIDALNTDKLMIGIIENGEYLDPSLYSISSSLGVDYVPFTGIPEPGSAFLGALVGLMVVLRRRRG